VTTMAKAKVSGIKSVFDSIKQIFERSTQQEEFLTKIKDFVVLRVQAETRKGKDLSRDGADQPNLSPGYIRMREGYVKDGTIKVDGTFFETDFSNLTLTGQMLKSLNGLVKPRQRTVEVFVEGRRDDGQTNQAVANDLAKRGRTFLGLDTKGKVRIRKLVLDEIRRQIRLRK
jgi:hypothetical protein